MKIQEFAGKTICVLGYGREGKAVVAALEQFAPGCEITIADKNEAAVTDHPKHWVQAGGGWLKNLAKFDVIIKSPGIPPQAEFEPVKNKLTSSTQIFLDSVADKGVSLVGVTGSKGKSTTSSLIHTILKTAKKDVHLVGNIGEPAIAHLAQAKKGTIFVMEMSSYQLMDLTASPHIAVITSFFPEHLDYHGNLANYIEAKKHVARFQTADDLVFFNAQSPGAAEIAKEGEGRKIPFLSGDSPIDISDTNLIGLHNQSNIAAACMVAATFGVDKKTTLKAVKAFQGLPHRLQFVGTHHGIDWIDDAISTTPESAIAALDALGDRVKSMILGGQDRGYDFDELAERIAQSSVEHVILFPGSGPTIQLALEKAKAAVTYHEASDMKQAILIAREMTPKGSICLLSTASPSYGMFKNFEDKGEQFRAEIEQRA